MAVERVRIPVGVEMFDARVSGPADGPLVLLLHGFPQTSAMWRRQLEALGAAGFRAVAPDQRGYSPGARPGDDDRYVLDRLVADVLAMADEMGGHTFHLVGHDWGGMVAWRLAQRHPQRLRTLAVLSTPHPAALRRALAGEDGSDQRRRSAYVALFRAPGAAQALAAADGAGLRRLFSSTGLPAGEEQPHLEVLADAGAVSAALAWYRANDVEVLASSEPVTTPTLYVWGNDDPALGPEA
ncbi:MAG: alpha/beta hydrolase, partial [Actinobacteria bacterium]|nr:alpha/beta hydrolase [Actinomycetota bacterium]